MKRWALYGISIVAHAGIGIALGRAHRPVARAATSISISETKRKPEPPKPAELPPAPEKELEPRSLQRAKSTRAEAKAESKTAEPAKATANAGFDAIPDFGLSLSGGSGGPGLAGAASQAPSRPTKSAVEKVVRRPLAISSASDGCDEIASKPKPKNVPTPAYTEAGRAAGIEGKVRVEVTVDETGRVVSVRLISGLGHGLDEAALDAAKHATFEPALRCGKPVPATFNIGMRFSI
ncbi:MAG: TonB family protein [Polyangiaceae bacterium]